MTRNDVCDACCQLHAPRVFSKQGKCHERITKNGLRIRDPYPGKPEFISASDPAGEIPDGAIGQDTDMNRDGHVAFHVNNG
jgi:hypothetical protein